MLMKPDMGWGTWRLFSKDQVMETRRKVRLTVKCLSEEVATLSRTTGLGRTTLLPRKVAMRELT